VQRRVLLDLLHVQREEEVAAEDDCADGDRLKGDYDWVECGSCEAGWQVPYYAERVGGRRPASAPAALGARASLISDAATMPPVTAVGAAAPKTNRRQCASYSWEDW
jgi:hypothetical protein